MRSTRQSRSMVFVLGVLVLLSLAAWLAGCGTTTPAADTVESLPVTWTPTASPEPPPAVAPTVAPTPVREVLPAATEDSAVPLEAARPLTVELQALVESSLPPTPTPEGGDGPDWGEIGIVPLEVPTGQPPLWAAYSRGMGFYDLEAGPFLALYAYDAGDWRELGRVVLTDCAQFIGDGALRQVPLEPSRVWLELESYTGAHGGCYDLFSYDGQTLRHEVGHFNSSPGAGNAADLDGDGILEVVLNWTENYVFCYACGVRLPLYDVLRWDGEDLGALTLSPLPEGAPDDLRRLHNHAVDLARAGLWPDAQALMAALPDQESLDLEFLEIVRWNGILIDLHAEALAEQVAAGIYPLLTNAFYGDYQAAADVVRPYRPEQIWTLDTPLIQETVAEGWEMALGDWLSWTTELALQLPAEPADLPPSDATRAAASFLRGWAHFLHEPAGSSMLPFVEAAAALAPSDPLYADSLAYLQAPALTGPYEPLAPETCYDLGQALARTLGVTVTIQEAAFEDYVGGDTGRGCLISAAGTGTDFAGPEPVADGLRGSLSARGWEEDVIYRADGPTGTAAGFWHSDRRRDRLCLLNVTWRAAEGADCPADRPIGECDLAPEQQLYTISLNCARTDKAPAPTATPRPAPTATPMADADPVWEVRTLLAGPGTPGRLYAFLTEESSGAWPAERARFLISDDDGVTWIPFPGGLPAGGCVRNVNLDYATPDALYASTCQGLYRWTGSAWALVSPRETGMVAIVYGQPDVMWATGAFADGGVFRSEDGGQSWQPAGDGLISFNGVANIGIDPRDANTLYAIIWPKYAGTYLRRGTAQGLWDFMPTPRDNATINTGMTIDGATGALYVVVNSPHDQLWRTRNPNAADMADIEWELIHDFGRELSAELLASGWSPEGLALYANLQSVTWLEDAFIELGEPQLHRSLDGGLTWQPLPIP